MRIDRIEIQNFKKFEHLTLDLNPHFTLLIGENGSGKTSVLDAIAVALGIWEEIIPGAYWREINLEDITAKYIKIGDRKIFTTESEMKFSVSSNTYDLNFNYARMLHEKTKTINKFDDITLRKIRHFFDKKNDPQPPRPIFSYYSAHRGVLDHQQSNNSLFFHRSSDSWVYYRCLDAEAISETDLNEWFLFEMAAKAQEGRDRKGFQAVKSSILKSIPESEKIGYDVDRKEIIFSVSGTEQPFGNLSAGQKMMLAMIADISMKAVTINSYLFGPGQEAENDPMKLLELTPGVVLIDELDVHLHPRWQRQVAANLKKIFPKIQFVCTSHSPQIIGELKPEEIRILEGDKAYTPDRSYGMDSNRVLEEIMGGKVRTAEIEKLLGDLALLIDEENFAEAKKIVENLKEKLGENDPEVLHANSLISFMEETG